MFKVTLSAAQRVRPTWVTSETQVSLCCSGWFRTEPQIPASQAAGTRGSHIRSQVLQPENTAKAKKSKNLHEEPFPQLQPQVSLRAEIEIRPRERLSSPLNLSSLLELQIPQKSGKNLPVTLGKDSPGYNSLPIGKSFSG